MAKDYRERICWIRRMASTILPSEEEKRGLYSLANNVSFDDRVNHFAELYRSMNLISTLPEYTKLRNVGVMYFSPEPEKFFPYAQINMVQFTDDLGGDQIIAKAFKGPLHQQLQKALQYIRNTGLQKIILAMKANGSSMPNFETDEERTYFLTMFLLHPDFTDTDDGINVGLNDGKTEYANLTAKERTVLYLIQQNQALRTKHIIRITEENPYEKTGYTQDRRV